MKISFSYCPESFHDSASRRKDKKYNIEQIEKSFEFLYEMLKDSNEKPTESVKENVKLFTIHKRTHQATEDPHPPVDPAT